MKPTIKRLHDTLLETTDGVIASHGGDPFVLDLSSSDGNDAPVLTAEHGMGEWDFGQVADSFAGFLKSLTK